MIKTNILIQIIVISPLNNTVLLQFRVSNVKTKLKTYIKLKPLISSLLWRLYHDNISFRSKVIPINVLKIPVLVLPVLVLNHPDNNYRTPEINKGELLHYTGKLRNHLVNLIFIF